MLSDRALPNRKTLGVVLGIVAVIATGVAAMEDMTFRQFLEFLIKTESLGAVASVLVTALRWVVPAVDEELASIASLLMAVLVAAVAKYLLGIADQWPPWIDEWWPIIAYVAQQIWWLLTSENTANKQVRKRSEDYYHLLPA